MSKLKRITLGLAVVFLIFATSMYIFRDKIITWIFEPTESSVQTGVERSNSDLVSVASENFETPWSVTFLPSGDMLVSERSGRLQRIGENGSTHTIEGVQETSEGGLLGVVLHPDFEQNQQVYVYLTTGENGNLSNKIDRYQYENDELANRQTILDDIPAASNHNGGAIAFGPDDKLYVTTGDAATPRLSQDTNSLAGKILRLNGDGSTPDDNPFGNLIWSYGHRNPQGIAWDEEGRLWSVEHGPSGADTGRDELNRIEKGGNYGWPEITGDETKDGMIAPVAQSGTDDTWAPAGLGYHDGSLYFAGLRGQSLYQATIQDDDTVSLVRHFTGEYGRLRAVTIHNDDLYLSTSNRDGRGAPRSQDDKILRIDLSRLAS